MHRGYPAIKVNLLRSILSPIGVKQVARKCDTGHFAPCRPAVLQNRGDSRQRGDAVQSRIARTWIRRILFEVGTLQSPAAVE
jgi:hypothetical protein